VSRRVGTVLSIFAAAAWLLTPSASQIEPGHFPPDPVFCLAFSTDGALLVRTIGPRVEVYDVAAGERRLELAGHDAVVTWAAFDATGGRLATVGLDRTVRLWDIGTGQALHALKGLKGEPWCVTFTSAPTRVVASDGEGQVAFWHPETGRLLDVVGLTPPEGHSIVYGPSVLSADGRLVADGYRLWDAATGALLVCFDTVESAWARAFDGPCARVARANYDHSVSLIDLTTGRESLRLSGGALICDSVAFSPDGHRVACAWHDGVVGVFSAQTGQRQHLLRAHQGAARAVAFSPDGRTLASSGEDHRIRLWDAMSGKLERDLPLPPEPPFEPGPILQPFATPSAAGGPT